ncbi:hypothetical protein GMLC_02320 [Geomonas limicola]|uniref:BioF2-like acetyltransferase domain-containing protein n=1 Tax=Geomonas limicola TaxID=2740186 RepID=A0A6V8N4V2_9BACT|nr:hypothetical protein [Geomonas limicola]GFO66653.1 hypothetical protein GMLC_02320 [Geomonas limicola]
MHWEPMTVDEYAGYRLREGLKLVKVDGVWWMEPRPCFFLPLFLFHEIRPWSRRYPTKALLGGVMHLVPPEYAKATTMNFHVHDDLRNYSLDTLSTRRRKITRDSLSYFTARPIADLEEFVEAGYQVYRNFYRRTGYWYKKERIIKDRFRAWSENLYCHPRIYKLGIYLEGRLCAVETSYQVEDVIFGDNLFSDDVSLKLNVVDFITHELRLGAAQTDARYVFTGLPSGVPTLDNSKSKKGCKLLNLPAYCKINPLALALARVVMKDGYRKLASVLSREEGEASQSPGFA